MLITLIIAAVIIGGVIFVIRQPDDFRITRTASMAAPASAIFTQINDFHKWEAWSPWAKMDPACRNSFEGALYGQGAVFRWSGNNKVGQGNMTITESAPPGHIVIRLEFLKPFKAINTTEFTFKPDGNQTVVTWSMQGKNNFMGKAMNLVMNCEKMVGGQFEKGLASIKAIVESAKS